MNFGEIVEPSTRALMDEDCEDYPEYSKFIPEWEGPSLPDVIENLFFVETNKILKLFRNCVLNSGYKWKIKNAGIEIYNVENTNNYIVVHLAERNAVLGEIVELFSEWLFAAKNIFTLTSDSISKYQNFSCIKDNTVLIKTLPHNANETKYDKLECPNLITGLGAGVLSYCIKTGLKCTSFIAYIDNCPLDSLNVGPILDLARKLGLETKTNEIRPTLDGSNLYV